MNQVSLYEKSDGTYQVSFINPIDQKRKRKTFGNSDEARDYKTKVEIDLHKGKRDLSDRLYLGHLLRLHLQRCPKSKVTDRKNAFKSFCDRFNHFETKNLSKEALEQWFDDFKNERNLTDKTMLHIKSQLNHFFRWLVDEEYLQSNPLTKIKYKRHLAPKRPRVILSQNEVKSLIEELKNYDQVVLYPLILTVAYTGARRSEVIGIDWNDVDFETNFIHFRNTKNGEDRRVKMSKSLSKMLQSHPRYGDFVFFDKMGDRVKRHNLQRAIIEFKATSELKKDWRCHDLRHSFAYNFLKRSGEMYQLKAILGHKSIQMTIDLYGNFKAADVENPSPYDD